MIIFYNKFINIINYNFSKEVLGTKFTECHVGGVDWVHSSALLLDIENNVGRQDTKASQNINVKANKPIADTVDPTVDILCQSLIVSG